ncbi:MAG: cytidine deaminase [Armatimonadota bacterium]
MDAAISARQQAYAPYSNYCVGAALLMADGRIVTGSNVENASYGLSMCAERNAVFAAVGAGSRTIHACVVVTADGGTPCGACRQVLSEFHDDDHPMQIIAVTAAGAITMNTWLRDLLPNGFGFGGRTF